MVFGPSGRDHDSQNQYYLSFETPRRLKIIKLKPQISFANILFREIVNCWKSKSLKVLRKAWTEKFRSSV